MGKNQALPLELPESQTPLYPLTLQQRDRALPPPPPRRNRIIQLHKHDRPNAHPRVDHAQRRPARHTRRLSALLVRCHTASPSAAAPTHTPTRHRTRCESSIPAKARSPPPPASKPLAHDSSPTILSSVPPGLSILPLPQKPRAPSFRLSSGEREGNHKSRRVYLCAQTQRQGLETTNQDRGFDPAAAQSLS